MNCVDMMNIPELKKILDLKAGEMGLAHPIRWIYFADCLQCVQSKYPLKDYIHGGEFVILTNPSMTDDSDRLIDLLERMLEYDIAALGINEGQISDELICFCKENNLPLFELPEKYPLIDLSQIISRELVQEESNRNSYEQLFSAILSSENINKEYIFAQAEAINMDLNKAFYVVEFSIRYTDSGRNENNIKDIGLIDLGKNVKNVIYSVFSFLDKVIMLQQMGSILMLYPSDKSSEEELRRCLLQVVQICENKYDVKVDIGVGNSADYIEDIKRSRREASVAMKLAGLSDGSDRVSFYKEQGVYMLLSKIPEVKYLDRFVEDHIGKLIRADELNDGKLCDTLEKYINHNCNIKETSVDMFIHRNTLNYRLNKIRDILGEDFDNISNILLIKLAFMIRNFRAW